MRASAAVALLAAVAACLLGPPTPALALAIPTPCISQPAGLAPPGAILCPSPAPSVLPTAVPPPSPAATPASSSPTASPGGHGAGAGGGAVGGGGAAGPSPVASPAAAAIDPVINDSVIHTVLGPLPSQVPVFPVLLPLLAGLLLLLLSAVLAAYRRTQEARRFERLERTKSDFLKLASHELRTPLTVLRGYISMIRDGDVRPDTPAFQRALPIIEDRLNQVNTIVEQMLEAARLEDGPDRLNLESFDLAGVAADSIQAIRARAGETHPVDFSAPRGRLTVNLDRGRVAAIIDQLLDNAVKYSPDGGRVECIVEDSEGQVVVTVRDRGLGIAREDLERVFTRFGRLVTRDNSHIPGAGLGLFLARENARRMGGDLTVTSTPGQGSSFTLSLPLPAQPAGGTAPAGVPAG